MRVLGNIVRLEGVFVLLYKVFKHNDLFVRGVVGMDRPIGVIDSGVGGLTVAYELMRQLPNEEFIYIGDTLRCPYGSRRKDEIIQFTMEMIDFLIKKNVKMIVIACNTATAYTLHILREKLAIPIIGVIEPGARAAIKMTKTNHVGIIGTEGTVKSDAYKLALQKIHPQIMVRSLACPSFVPMIEKGMLTGDKAKKVVQDALGPLHDVAKMDTLILGCTHYPLIAALIREEMGEPVAVISSSEETARETSIILDVHHLLRTSPSEKRHEFYMTGDLKAFQLIVTSLFQKNMANLAAIHIEQTKIG